MIRDGKRVLVTGGTGSLGQVIVRRLLTGEMGKPARITVFSRDEAKQHYMRLSYLHKEAATDEVIYRNFQELLSFRIGDVRDYSSLLQAARDVQVVIHAAALKQVPSCEYFPFEAVQTNIGGAQNLVRVVREHDTPVQTVVGISTDKACKPINVMGMTKAVMERILVEANIDCKNTRFACVRYGNVIASRGSVVPLFLEQIAHWGAGDHHARRDDAVSPQPPPGRRHRIRGNSRGSSRRDLHSASVGGAHGRPGGSPDRRTEHPDRLYRNPPRRENPRDHGLRGRVLSDGGAR